MAQTEGMGLIFGEKIKVTTTQNVVFQPRFHDLVSFLCYYLFVILNSYILKTKLMTSVII